MKIKYISLILLLVCCSEKQEDISFSSSKFEDCNELLYNCNNARGDYCLFGFKWGMGNNFLNVGVNVEGPKIKGGIVSFSFQESPNRVSNHSEVDVPTLSFDQLPACGAKENIRRAFRDWSRVANIQFDELPEDSESDIKIFVAKVLTRGNGFPNFTSSLCQQLEGYVILSPDYTSDCQIFYAYVLHEIGHSLGLGHSSEDNLMGSIKTNLDGL